MTTTNWKDLLFGYRDYDTKYPCNIRLLPANGEAFVPKGYGVLRIPADTDHGYIPIISQYTPELATIVSPDSIETMMGKENVKGTQLMKDKFCFKFTAFHALRSSENIVV